MTLSEAIIHCEEVADRCAVTDGDLKCEMQHRQLAEWLKELRHRRAERRWIPCSDRLPEEGHDVLITKEPSKIKGYEQKVIKAKRSADPRSGKIEWWSPELGTLTNKAVLAWMPLPEPYKEE